MQGFGYAKIVKQSEDGKVEGLRFRITGNGIDEVLTTGADGTIVKDGLLPGEYTISEIDIPDQYVQPESLTVTVVPNQTAVVTFSNILKKFKVEIQKADTETGQVPQGDATYSGAVYGLYHGDDLVETLTLGENGSAVSKEYTCGEQWNVKEITPPEGYLLDETVHPVGANPGNFTVERTTLNMTVRDTVIKGKIAIVKYKNDSLEQIKTPEENAEFQVYLKSAGSYHAAKENERDLIHTDRDGNAATKDLPYGTYVVHQTKGSEGFFLADDFEVTINEHSKTYQYIVNNELITSKIKVRLPRRFSEGYGLSSKVIDEISDGMLITVDNGIAAVEEIAAAKEKGLTVVIIDHHLPNPEKGLPPADVIVDPNALPNSEFNGYCGAGLSYKLAMLSGVCDTVLKENIAALAAIGTVADVMPLIHDNRNIVIEGLEAINKGHCPKGLEQLLETLGLYEIDETDIGFKIGPILNAVGRLYDDGSKYAVQLLATDNYNPQLPHKLIEINEARKQYVNDGMQTVELTIAENCLYGDIPLLVYQSGKSIHEGIVGILAGRLAEKFHVPAFVLTDSEEPGLLKGSGRSFGEFNLKEMLDGVSEDIYAYGGHAGAAGITIKQNKLEELRLKMQNKVKEMGFENSKQTNTYDLVIQSEQIPELSKELAKYQPFGEGNPKIIFKIENYKLVPKNGRFFQNMGNNGTVLKLFGNHNSAIGFGLSQNYNDQGQPTILNLYGNIGINRFNGHDEIQIEMLDLEKAVFKRDNALSDMLAKRMQAF